MMNKRSNGVYVIAEIGINHEGDVEVCAEMIDSAAEIGVDAVKLQTIDAGSNYEVSTDSYKIFKSSELTRKETADMFNLAHSNGLDIFTTAGDTTTIEWVDQLNPSCWKISSGLLNHIPIIRHLASLQRPLLMSTGLANIDDIDLAVETIKSTGNDNISIFQCTSLYPAPINSLNLSTIRWLKKRYGYDVGFSDHSLGSDAAFLSVAAGATLIEKHFSLDPGRSGFDHGISLDPKGFKEMILRIRMAEEMMGQSEKNVSQSIQHMRDNFLRSIVAIDNITKGDIFSTKNIGVRRTLPNIKGSEPKYFDDIVSSVSKKNFNINDPIIF